MEKVYESRIRQSGLVLDLKMVVTDISEAPRRKPCTEGYIVIVEELLSAEGREAPERERFDWPFARNNVRL
jgi:hypothetical protein